MKSDILLDAFGLISDEYVQDAKSVQNVKKKHKRYVWLGWGAMAACACLLVSVTIGSGLWSGSDTTSNSAPQMENAESYIDSTGNSNCSTNENSSASEETDGTNQSAYPYSDTQVLDYVGMELADMETAAGVIVFNEITDIEGYRDFNNRKLLVGETYYDTHNAVNYHALLGQSIESFLWKLEDGELVERSDIAVYEPVKNKWPQVTTMAEYLLEDEGIGNTLRGLVVGEPEAVTIEVYPAEGPNGIITVLAGTDLDGLSEQMQSFLLSFRETLGTQKSSVIAGQEVAVQYFYQQRMFKQEALEECYNYYVYFEKDGMQYLYQYSSNWTLPGEEVTAIHNPPHSMSYAMSQEKSRELFAEVLQGIIKSLE